MGIQANQEVYEGQVVTPIVITLSRKSRNVEIINDSGTRDLQYKFKASESYATLKPLEAVSMAVNIRNLYLTSPGRADYRIRVLN